MDKEYIEREAVKKHLGDVHFQGYGDAILAVMEVHAADVVEVVRCRDCKYMFKGPLDELMCKKKMLGIVRPEDFCSFGERRDNNANH